MLSAERRYLAGCGLWLAVLGCGGAPAKSVIPAAAPAAAPARQEAANDMLGRGTPLGTVRGFLDAARRRDDKLAARYLGSNLRTSEAEELAHELFVVLNRRMPARLNQISGDPEGSTSDSLPLSQELVGSITTAQGKLDVLLERVDGGTSGFIWLFSPTTLGAVPDLYAEVSGESRPEALFPRFLVTNQVAGVPLYGWLLALVGMPLIYLLTGLPLRVLARLPARWRRHLPGPAAAATESAERPIRLLVLALLIAWLTSVVAFSLRARQFWGDTAATISIVAVVWLFVVLNARCEQYLRSHLTGRNLLGTASVLRLARRTIDVVIVVVGLLVVLHHFGADPTAALAGLGVGGIAVALAAQKTLENVIAGVSLILDRAVRVGDVLKVGGFEGTVDEIGVRSTRIRTWDRTVVSVPNGQVATMTLETLSARDKYWFHPLLRLRCDSTVAQVRRVVEGVRALLSRQPTVDPDSVRVRFLGFGTASLDVDVHAYVLAGDWNGFLEIQEDLLFRVLEIVQEAGTGIAIPSQRTYLEANPL